MRLERLLQHVRFEAASFMPRGALTFKEWRAKLLTVPRRGQSTRTDLALWVGWCKIALLIVCPLAHLHGQEATAWRDPSPHKVQFVTVDENVRLEVLDWGGTGRPIVLLAGGGNTAHVFDDFAPKLTPTYHVYGITRRGFGASSITSSGYTADRLGDDVVEVLDALELTGPVLAGHSLGGEELSSIGSRHPERVGGLVYLDAGYSYAFDNGKGMTTEAQQKPVGDPPPQPPAPTAADRASFTAFQAWTKRTSGITFPEAELRQSNETNLDGSVGKGRTPITVLQAINTGFRKFTDIRVPVLAIYATTSDLPPWLQNSVDSALRAAGQRSIDTGRAMVEKQAKVFEDGVPTARVVLLPHAQHYVFLSNELDVLREMRAFLATLK